MVARLDHKNFWPQYMQAVAYVNARRYQEAVKLLRDAPGIASPECQDLAYFQIGEIDLEAGDKIAASQAFKKSRYGYPHHDRIYFLKKLGSYSEWQNALDGETLRGIGQ